MIAMQHIIIGAACLLGAVLLLASLENSKRWERFKKDHHCTIVGDNNHGATTYRCDDGVDTR